MAQTYLGFELGKAYFESKYRDEWAVYEFNDNSLIYTRYQSALIEGGGYANRFLQRFIWEADFEFINGTQLTFKSELYSEANYLASWDSQNNLIISEGESHKSNSKYADYGWWNNTPLTSVINSEIATQKLSLIHI